MPDEQSVLQAVIALPDDDAPRLAYGNWCDQRGAPPPDPRGEFIGLQIELERVRKHGFDAPDHDGEVRQRLAWLQNTDREAELRSQYESAWARPVSAVADRCTFQRGFIGHVALPASRFLDEADRLFSLAPIVHVELTDSAAVLEKLFASPHLERVRALSLSNNGIGDADVQFLCDSTRLKNLWWLDLSFNPIGEIGVEALAAAQNLRNLFFLSLQNNPCDPSETLGVEGQVIVDASLPQEGRDLEARFGTIPWLHCHADSVLEFPPDPLGPPQRP